MDNLHASVRALDPEVYDRISANMSDEDLASIQSILLESLDKQNRKFPGPFPKEKKEGLPGGCRRQFLSNYTKLLEEYSTDVDGVIVISNATRIVTSKKALIVLKAILRTGQCSDPDLAAACSRIFLSIVKDQKDGRITDESLSKSVRRITEEDGYFLNELKEAILAA